MGKIFLTLCSFFLNITNNHFEFYQETIAQEVIVAEENYEIIDNGLYKLVYGNETITTFPRDTNIKIKKSNHLYVVYLIKDELHIEVYDNFNRLIKETKLPGKFSNYFDIAIIDNKLIIVGGIKKYDDLFEEYKKSYFGGTDAFIFTLNHDLIIENIKIYGGSLNEYFSKIYYFDNNYYFLGIKETLSGGDFGNGGGKNGGYLCVKSDEYLIMQDYCISKEEIYDLAVYDNKIYIVCENNIYELNSDLQCNYSFPLLAKAHAGILTFNNLAVIISTDELMIYDLESEKMIASNSIANLQFKRIVNGKFIFSENDKLLALTIYDLRDFISNYDYDGEIKNEKINNLFSEIPLTKTESNFDPLIYGEYSIDYYYQDYKVSGKITVPFEANVSDGFIYPLGYRLLFTGIGYLNGELIINNHPLYHQGNYQLVLYGNSGEEKVINFRVDKDQISFTEYQNKNWDYTIYPYQEFQLIIHHDYNDYEVTNIKINNLHHQRFAIEPQKLIIFLSENTPGIKKIDLQEITFKINNHQITKKINYSFCVNVLKNTLSVQGDFTDDEKYLYYDAIVSDQDAEIRGINVKVVGGGEELYYHFPICDRDLLLTGLNPNKTYQCTINLAIDEGDGIFKDFSLFQLNYTPNQENVRIGEINILQKGQTLEKFRIMLRKNPSLINLSLDDEIIYEYQKPQYHKVIIISFISGFIIFGIIIFISRKKRRFL